MGEGKKEKTSTDKKEEPMIFLEDGSILPWMRPVGEGYIESPFFHMLNGSTKIKQFLEYPTLDTQVGKYTIFASAAMYLADIARLGKIRYKLDENEQPKAEEEILFAGGIQIYQNGIIPGTEIKGMDFVKAGHIWCAQKPETIPRDSDGLKRIIFGHEETTEGKEKRIEAIIRGYEYQERKEEEREDHVRFESYRSGKFDQWEHGGLGFPDF